MKRTIKNTNMKPLSHSSYSRLQVLCQSFHDVVEKLKVLNDLSLNDLTTFIPELRSQVLKYVILGVKNLPAPGAISGASYCALSNIFFGGMSNTYW